MIIFFYGEDNFRIQAKTAEVINEYKTRKKGLNFRIFDAEEIDGQDFLSELSQRSIFSGKKLLVLKNIFSAKGFKAFLLDNKKVLFESDDVLVMVQAGKILKTDKLFSALKKNATVQEIGLLEGKKLLSWVEEEFAKQKIKIDPLALAKLLSFTGNDTWRLYNEIQKLASHAKQGCVLKNDVEILVRPKIDSDIFKTIDSMARKDKKEALRLLYGHIERGDSHLYLFSMIAYQFKNLLIAKSLEAQGNFYGADFSILSKRTGMHPYVLRKSFAQSRLFAFRDLKKIYQKVVDADLRIKTGKIEPSVALDLLVAQI